VPDSIIANDPAHVAGQLSTEDIEEEVKRELLKELSVDDIRQMITLAKSGFAKAPNEYPDSFDEYGRNFRRMLHRMTKISPSTGKLYYEDRPMAMSADEARRMKPPGDYFDPDEKVWILRGVKRARDYAENTVEYWEERSGATAAPV
jgi:hypothetical protein